MANHRFILEPYKGKKTRHTCPRCGKQQTFARYIVTETGEYLSNDIGRCNRERNCGYHTTPRQYFQDNPESLHRNLNFEHEQNRRTTVTRKSVSVLPAELFKSSLKGYSSNNFIIYLQDLFGKDVTEQLVSRYFIGTSAHWKGATVFYQIDTTGKIRAGKIMLYNAGTGKRVKEPFNHLTWVHSAMGLPNYNLEQCFFGEHLLNAEPDKPVAIAESEKTAIIASGYLHEYIWLAAGGIDGLSAEKCQVLKGRKVFLFPDLNGYEKWSAKAIALSHIATFTVSDLLERRATEIERKQGLDLADYLVRYSYRMFIKPDTVQVDPKRLLTKEFYHYTFEELTELLGETKALEKVRQYIALSRKFKSCKTYILHNCQLLNTYYSAQQQQFKQAS